MSRDKRWTKIGSVAGDRTAFEEGIEPGGAKRKEYRGYRVLFKVIHYLLEQDGGTLGSQSTKGSLGCCLAALIGNFFGHLEGFFEHGIFYGITTYTNSYTFYINRKKWLVYNRVGVGRSGNIRHWLAAAGITPMIPESVQSGIK